MSIVETLLTETIAIHRRTKTADDIGGYTTEWTAVAEGSAKIDSRRAEELYEPNLEFGAWTNTIYTKLTGILLEDRVIVPSGFYAGQYSIVFIESTKDLMGDESFFKLFCRKVV